MPGTPSRYNEPLPDYGDVMTVAEWLQLVTAGTILDQDGHGHAVRDGLMDASERLVPSLPVVRGDATHVVWFNR